MPHRLLYLVCAALLMAACGRASDADRTSSPAPDTTDVAMNTLTDAERADGWRLLFDGETTDGWHNYGADTISGEWQVEDGTLTLTEAGGGDIVTDEPFASFELKLEWKLSECGNSGLFFHVAPGHDSVWQTGPEVQILDNTCHPDAEAPTHRAGANYDLHAPVEDMTNPATEWNQMRLVVDGDHVQHYLNGTKIVDYRLWTDEWRQQVAESKFSDLPYGEARTGFIALQDHSDRVWFRNIKIRELDGNASGTS